jgi:TetR/AcrR family transcriptional regulator, cholesterol catabolism regulator
MKTELSTVRTFSPNNGLVEERRLQIAQAALHLIATKGIEKTNIREIAAASEMTIGNLYHYIGTREDIIYLAFQYGLDQVRTVIKETNDLCETLEPRQALSAAIDLYIRYHHTNSEGTVFLYKEMGGLSPALRLPVVETNSQMHDVFIRLIQKGCKTGVFRAANVDLIASTIVSMGDMWALKRWQFKKSYTLDKYIRAFTEMILTLLGCTAGVQDE